MLKNHRTRLAALAAAALVAAGFAPAEEQPVRVELISEHASIQPGGATRVGVYFEIEEGWHIYAEHPGEEGLPTTVAWSGPAGTTFGPLSWPDAYAFLDGGAHTYGYSGVVVLRSTMSYHALRDAAEKLDVRARVSWLACKALCVPGKANLSLALPVTTAPPVRSAHAEYCEHTH